MTTIKLHNTKTRTKEDFVPIRADDVRMYVCGPTVYDRAHIGNARPVIVFDVLYRLLRHVYGAEHVTYVRNFTDVDDRINETAQKRKAGGAEGSLEELIEAGLISSSENSLTSLRQSLATSRSSPRTPASRV